MKPHNIQDPKSFSATLNPDSSFARSLKQETGLIRAASIIVVCLINICGMTESAQAALLYVQSFEAPAPSNAWTYSVSNVSTVSGGSFAVSSVTGSTDGPANQRILNDGGSNSFQVIGATGTLTFAAVDVSLYENVYISVRVSSTGGNTNNGNDGDDFVRLYTSINGATYATNDFSDVDGLSADIALRGAGNAQWGFDGTRTATTTAGTHINATANSGYRANGYSTLRIDLADATSTVGLRFDMSNGNTLEIWNIDGIAIYGTLRAAAAPEPSRMLLLLGGLGFVIWRRRR